MKDYFRVMNSSQTLIRRIDGVVFEEQYDEFDSDRYHVIDHNIEKLVDKYDLSIHRHNSCLTISNPANGAFFALPNYESSLTNMMDAVDHLNRWFPNNRITHFDETEE